MCLSTLKSHIAFASIYFMFVIICKNKLNVNRKNKFLWRIESAKLPYINRIISIIKILIVLFVIHHLLFIV